MFTLLKMAIGWAKMTKKMSHVCALIFSFFWMRYILDATFRHSLWDYVHTLPGWAQGLIGFGVSFIMWYHNPALQKRMEKDTETYEKDSRIDLDSDSTDGDSPRSDK